VKKQRRWGRDDAASGEVPARGAFLKKKTKHEEREEILLLRPIARENLGE